MRPSGGKYLYNKNNRIQTYVYLKNEPESWFRAKEKLNDTFSICHK